MLAIQDVRSKGRCLLVNQIREKLSAFGVETTLTDVEISRLVGFQFQTNTRDIAIIGKAGSGKDTAGEIIRKHAPSFGTDNMADDLKKGALITFQSIKKDRPLLQGLSQFRSLLPSCYLDNVWRRILYRRSLTNEETVSTTFESPQDVVAWWKERLFPRTKVEDRDIEQILQKVYDERFGDGAKWWSLFRPMTLEEVFQPVQSVVLTDCRFPNEFFLAFSLGSVCIRMLCDDEIRIERLRKRDGHVDVSRLNHESETALDHIFVEDRYENVRRQIIPIDNNGSIEDTEKQLLRLNLKRVA